MAEYTDSKLRAILCVNVFAICQVATNSMFKVINNYGVTPIEWMIWRNISCLLLVLLILRTNKVNPFDKDELKGKFKWVLGRVISGQCDFCLFYYSGLLIPISLLMIMVGTTPLWSSIMGMIINQEKVMWFEYLAMALCFAGLVPIALSRGNGSGDIPIIGVVSALGVAWCFSMCQVSQRRCKEVFYAVVNFYHTLGGALAGCIYLFLQWMISGETLPSHSWQVNGFLALMCLVDFVGVNCMTMAFQSADSTFVAIVGYCIVVYGFLVDIFYFKEPLTGWDLAGALLIFLVTVATSVIKMKTTKTEENFSKQN